MKDRSPQCGDRRSGRLKLLQKLGERPQILGVSVAQCNGVNQGVLLRSGLVLFGFLLYISHFYICINSMGTVNYKCRYHILLFYHHLVNITMILS